MHTVAVDLVARRVAQPALWGMALPQLFLAGKAAGGGWEAKANRSEQGSHVPGVRGGMRLSGRGPHVWQFLF